MTRLLGEAVTSLFRTSCYSLRVLLFFLTSCYSLRVLLLGDSVDRFTLFDWCEAHGENVTRTAFGDDNLIYHHGNLLWPPTICREKNEPNTTSLAQIHFYGTNSTGHYHSHPARIYPMQNTSERLPHALKLYLQETKGLFPERVIWHSATWDAGYTAFKFNKPQRHSAQLNRTIIYFEYQLNARLDEIERFFNYSVEIGLRTSATSKTITCCSPSFNDVIRAVAKKRKLLLYDVDYDIWSSFLVENGVIYNRHVERHASELQHTLDHNRYDRVLFRDVIHPVSSVTAAAAEKLLGRWRSGALFLPREKKGEASKADLHFSSSSSHYAVLVRRESDASGSIDYFRPQSGRWYRNVSLELVRALRLSGFDVVPLTLEQERHVLADLPGPAGRMEDYGFAGIGAVFNGSDKANPWLCCTYAVTRDLYRTELPSEAAALGIARARGSKVFNVPLAWRELLLAIPQTRDLPEGFVRDGARLRLRGSRGDWLVANFSRHPAASGGAVQDVDEWAWSVIPPQSS